MIFPDLDNAHAITTTASIASIVNILHGNEAGIYGLYFE